jgi:hypothetical protein
MSTAQWPPRPANRATRRACHHISKGNNETGYYCVNCGTLLHPGTDTSK